VFSNHSQEIVQKADQSCNSLICQNKQNSFTGIGIKRALEEWRDIDFTDDREGCLFTVTIHRKVHRDLADLTGYRKGSGKGSGKTENQVFAFLSDNPEITIPELAEKLGLTTRAVEKQIAKLREKGRLRRICPARGGHWQTIEKDET